MKQCCQSNNGSMAIAVIRRHCKPNMILVPTATIMRSRMTCWTVSASIVSTMCYNNNRATGGSPTSKEECHKRTDIYGPIRLSPRKVFDEGASLN
jgi:hypothetical protein